MFKAIKKWWNSFHRWEYSIDKHARICQVCLRCEEKKYDSEFHSEDPFWVTLHQGKSYEPCSENDTFGHMLWTSP